VKWTNNYSLLAPFYDGLTKIVFGRELSISGAHYLNTSPIAEKRILIPGIGTGTLFDELKYREDQIPAVIIGVDSSKSMLQRSSGRIQKSHFSKIFKSKNQDFFTYNPQEKYDLIIVNFFLDCLPERQIKVFMEKCRTLISASGRLVINDFHLKKGKSSLKQRIIISLAYIFFKLSTNIPRFTLPNLDSPGYEKQWMKIEGREHLNGFIKTVVLQAREEN
jgi:ubiquinone/menaquinone biosynthesis C-methylase UbiE